MRESVSALTDRECRFPPGGTPGISFLKEDKQIIDSLTLNDGKTTLGPWKMDVEVVDIYDYHKNPNALLAHCKATVQTTTCMLGASVRTVTLKRLLMSQPLISLT